MRVAGLSALGKKSINLYGQNFSLASLDADEQVILEDNFNKLMSTTDSQVRRIFEERADTIVAGIMAIKEKLERRKFRGMNPGDGEIGFGFIRPGFTKNGNVAKAALPAPTAQDAINFDWELPLTGMGTWDGFLGSDATTGYGLPEDFGLIITHLASQVTPVPFIRHVRFQIGRVSLIPEEISDILMGDNENGVAVYPVPTKVVLPEDEFLVRVEGFTGTEFLKLGGLVIGLGRILKVELLAGLTW